jgi:hypothetical protein
MLSAYPQYYIKLMEDLRKAGCSTFPARIAYPSSFLTLCAGVDYTNKFENSLGCGLWAVRGIGR